MRYMLVDDSIIEFGSRKRYDVTKSGDLINLVNDLNTLYTIEIELRNNIYQKDYEINSLKIENELLRRDITARQLHISSWHSSSSDKNNREDIDEDE